MKCKCDNQAAVAASKTHASRDLGMSHLLRCLTFIDATLGCRLIGEYIDTRINHLADDLSRGNTLSFLSKVLIASQ